MDEVSVIGTCTRMCPDKEIKMRIKEKLVHYFERGDDGAPSAEKMVKEYKRSAAGIELCQANDLRTMGTLRSTVNYLLTSIVRDTRRPFHQVYDFVFDRLRCIRQEIVILNLSEEETLELLEPQIIFLAFSYYELCDADLSKFDPKICGQHLQECLKRALKCYDDVADKQKVSSSKRGLIESIYMIFNLGSEESMQRAVAVRNHPDLKFESDYLTSWMVSKHCWHGNYYRAIKVAKQLPVLLQGLVYAKHIQQWRERLLKEFSCAYNSPNGSVPVEFLLRVLSVDASTLKSLAQHFNMECVTSELSSLAALRFCKKTHRYDADPLKPRKEIRLSFAMI